MDPHPERNPTMINAVTEFFGDMLVRDWTVPEYDLAEARRMLKQSRYRGEPIPYRLLNNYYTAQTSTAQILIEGWREAGNTWTPGIDEDPFGH